MRKLFFFLIFIFMCNTSYGAVEDFSDGGIWTETDSADDITVTSTKVDVSTMREDANSVVSGDYGVGNFLYFTHEYEIYIDACSANTAQMSLVTYNDTAASTITDQVGNTDGWGLKIYCSGSDTFAITFTDWENGRYHYLPASVDTLYYVRVVSSAKYKLIEVFSDSARTTLVGSLIYQPISNAYQYISVGGSDDDGSGTDTITGYVQNLEFVDFTNIFLWGASFTNREATYNVNWSRCMGGTSHSFDNMKLTSVSANITADASANNVRLAVYQGGSLSTGPDGATLIKDFGTVANPSTSGWATIDTSDDLSLTKDTVTWICIKGNDNDVGLYAYNDSGGSGDFQTGNGRWASDCESTDETDGFDATWCVDGGAFSTYWYQLNLTYEIDGLEATDFCADANAQGCWLMEDATTESDESGEGEDLTVSAGDSIPQSTTKVFGTYSRDFETGDDDYLYAADGGSTDISGANQNMSVCAWYYRESDTGSGEAIVAKYDHGSSDKQYVLQIDGEDDYKFTISNDGSASADAEHATTVYIEKWNHICGVYDESDTGKELKIYVNGWLEDTTTFTAGIYDGSALFAIGSRFDSGSTYKQADGFIDDVIIYDRAISPNEVLEHFYYGISNPVVGGARRIMLIH